MKYELTIECDDECKLIAGSRTRIVNELRKEWRLTRRTERNLLNLDEGANSLPDSIHPSKVITSSSVEIESMKMHDLMRGLNGYELKRYKIKTP